MQEVTGSSPVSPTITSRRQPAHRASSGTRRAEWILREPGQGWKPDDRLRIGTTRERPANRPGSRPITRPRVRHRPVAKAGGTGRVKPLVLSMDEGFRDSREVSDMSQNQGDAVAVPIEAVEGGIDEAIEIGLEAPERGSAAELMDHGAAGELGPMRHSAA